MLAGPVAAVARRRPRLRDREWLALLLVGAFAWSVSQVDWAGGVVHAGGWHAAGDLVTGLLTPDLSAHDVGAAAEAAWTTVAYAMAGLSLAVALAIPLALLASGVVVRGARRRRWSAAGARVVLGGMRAVHELVWAWLFVASIGISPFAAIFALAIPFAGILGRIYADRLQDVPEPPLRALRSAGAGEGRVLLYGRLPIARADLTSYTFYRLECGLRSSAIMGFVGISGLGFQIQLALNDIDFSRASTFLVALIILIAGVELWSSAVRRRLTGGAPPRPGNRALGMPAVSALAAGALLTASWAWIWAEPGAQASSLFAEQTLRDALHFLGELLGVRNAPATPAFLDPERWWEVLRLAYDTLVMSVLAIGLVAIGVLPTVVPGARTSLGGGGSRVTRGLRWLGFLAVRGTYVLTRSIPELVWALLLVFVMTPGLLVGAVALAVHNFGIVGKLAAEVVEDVDPAPSRALRASGARGGQVLAYGLLPQVLPQFLTYALYRWEVILRTTVVVGFVAASGLGREFRLSMSFFHFTDVALILFVYFLLVVAGDAVSARLRGLAR